MSATLPPHVLSNIQYTLGFDMKRTFFINLGNNRPNIMPIVCQMRSAAMDLSALDFTVDKPLSGAPFIRTIIFVNTRDLTYKTSKHIKSLLPPELASKVDFMHAGHSTRAKRKVMHDFREGRISILCATEAAGMVSVALYYLTLLTSF
jgi:superfamily II DNA helicase RecQ